MMTKSQLKARHKALERELAQLSTQIETQDEIESGDRPSPEQAKRIATQDHSYGVTFVRRQARKGKLVLTSKRRFSSKKEAEQHGRRFQKKHRHQEFSVCIQHAKANAWINWKTGKTNPAL